MNGMDVSAKWAGWSIKSTVTQALYNCGEHKSILEDHMMFHTCWNKNLMLSWAQAHRNLTAGHWKKDHVMIFFPSSTVQCG